jgi:mitochondrial fission protein ELM1
MPSPSERKPLLVWLLTGDKGGDNAQMRSLAKAAGLQPVEIPLAFNELHRRSNLRLGASTRSLTDAARANLQPPWPDVVLSSGRRGVPIARWIKSQSGGRTKLIHVGRPWGRLAWFDLVFAMPQYGLPERANVFQARMPFNRPDPQALAAAGEKWRERFAAYPRPWIGVLVGGRSAPFVFDVAEATELGRTVSQRASAQGGSVLAVTSPRTGEAATAALKDAMTAPGFVHAWRAGDSDNPYLAILALADELIVTTDSGSMLAEAIRSGKPVAIAPLPRRLGKRRRRVALMRKFMPRWLFDQCIDMGVFTSVRDMSSLQQRLVDEQLASLLNGKSLDRKIAFIDDINEAVERIRTVLK